MCVKITKRENDLKKIGFTHIRIYILGVDQIACLAYPNQDIKMLNSKVVLFREKEGIKKYSKYR